MEEREKGEGAARRGKRDEEEGTGQSIVVDDLGMPDVPAIS